MRTRTTENMKDEKYNRYVKHVQCHSERLKQSVKPIEDYPIYVYFGEKNRIWFRFKCNLGYYQADENSTLKDVAKEIANDFYFIKSVRFYDETPYSAGIII